MRTDRSNHQASVLTSYTHDQHILFPFFPFSCSWSTLIHLTLRDLFTRSRSDRTKGNGSRLKEGGFRLDVRKKFFPMRVVRHWHRLPRGAVDAPSLKFSRPGWTKL